MEQIGWRRENGRMRAEAQHCSVHVEQNQKKPVESAPATWGARVRVRVGAAAGHWDLFALSSGPVPYGVALACTLYAVRRVGVRPTRRRAQADAQADETPTTERNSITT